MSQHVQFVTTDSEPTKALDPQIIDELFWNDKIINSLTLQLNVKLSSET